MGQAVLFGHWAWISLIYRSGVMAAEFGIGIDTSNSAGSPPFMYHFHDAEFVQVKPVSSELCNQSIYT